MLERLKRLLNRSAKTAEPSKDQVFEEKASEVNLVEIRKGIDEAANRIMAMARDESAANKSGESFSIEYTAPMSLYPYHNHIAIKLAVMDGPRLIVLQGNAAEGFCKMKAEFMTY